MFSAQVIADSLNSMVRLPDGRRPRITTMKITFPRYILAEFNTHRAFSRNSASSRAIPFKKMLKMVEENPFIPMAFQKDHSGMQGTEYLTGSDNQLAISVWLDVVLLHVPPQAYDISVFQPHQMAHCDVSP